MSDLSRLIHKISDFFSPKPEPVEPPVPFPAPSPKPVPEPSGFLISQKAIDLIISFEVTDKKTYEKLYQRSEWPGLSSGITVGIGYDLGYNSREQIREDWDGLLPDAMVENLASFSGLTGTSAKSQLDVARRIINVPWEPASKLFLEKTVNKWIKITKDALPNTDLLSPDCLGALVSLTYNRGPSYSSDKDRAREMRNIKDHMKYKDFHEIPREIRNMKRLWSDTTRGLLVRRDAEAQLFEEGLNT